MWVQATFKHRNAIVLEYPFEIEQLTDFSAKTELAFSEFARKCTGFSILDEDVSVSFGRISES